MAMAAASGGGGGEEKKQDEEGQCFLDGMDLLKDATENKRFLPMGLQGYSYLQSSTRFLEAACAKVNNGSSKICLLIIDSISSILAPINGGKYPRGRSMMISVAMILKKLAYEHNLSVLVTNHMVAGNGAPKPALGESWKTVPHVRLLISRERGSNICAATVLKHTLLDPHGKFAKAAMTYGKFKLL